MKAERLAEIRSDIPALHAMMHDCKTYEDECPATEDHTLVEYASELLAYVDDLTGQLERARDLCVRSGYFQSNEDDEAAGGYQSPCDHDKRITTSGMDGRPPWTYCDDCGKEVPNPTVDRPSVYDMPVGSVVVADYDGEDAVTYERHALGWVAEDGGAGIQPSATIEGLFTDGLVTEWRVP